VDLKMMDVPMNSFPYPDAVDPSLVGTYPAEAGSGGGYVWDDILEYRVWCHPERGAADEDNGNDYYLASHSAFIVSLRIADDRDEDGRS
jgi:hypothetical protein